MQADGKKMLGFADYARAFAERSLLVLLHLRMLRRLGQQINSFVSRLRD